MSRPTRPSPEARHCLPIVERLLMRHQEDPADRAAQLSACRDLGSASLSREIDMRILTFTDSMRESLEAAGRSLNGLKEQLDKLTAAPWRLGVFYSMVETPKGPRALVHADGGRRLVALAEEVSPDGLRKGDWVFLNEPASAVLAKAPVDLDVQGELGSHKRRLDGRLVLETRDGAEVVVEIADALAAADLKPGDLIRWGGRSGCWMAMERIERTDDVRFLVDEPQDVLAEHVGGQAKAVHKVLRTLKASLVAPELARQYGLTPRQHILLYGPPGCGKTLIARLAAAELGRLTGKPCKFASVKPGEFLNEFVGVTERLIRECFAALEAAAGPDGLGVLFLDEIEGLGRHRGSAVGVHNDRFLAALLAELDGFAARPNLALLAATNRKDLCDAALVSRFNVQLSVGRPDMAAAREIVEIHLPSGLPFSPNGQAAAGTRRLAVDRAVARLYAPNAGNEICTLKFRDGRTRTVLAGELTSGRLLAQVCEQACRRAFERHLDTGGKEGGVCVEDIDEAIADAIDELRTTLTPYNVRQHLDGLPQDVDVVAVEPVRRRVDRPHRYRAR